METCPWCEKGKLASVNGTVYWELPDGTRAVEITETPSSHCQSCDALFQSDEIVKEIENQLFLIDSKQLEKQTTYSELMNMKRLLKRNYFDF
ncbi:YokU family protein [Peribacillus simplex]|uniref:YokU family protein n=1 Tax=Peribacillus simplex TaxID=1478 RepID=A0A9X8ZGG4_9BACI|nr:YokU family protein [Peribacillus simplex]TKH05593.1 YokU family protein [Peribacillus simplex]TKH10759.1 YokU family protein [Peribacillus simplex]